MCLWLVCGGGDQGDLSEVLVNEEEGGMVVVVCRDEEQSKANAIGVIPVVGIFERLSCEGSEIFFSFFLSFV